VLLEKEQRNAIFKAIQEVGLDPSEFDFDYGDAEGRISHRRSESYFMIGGDPGKYVGSYLFGEASLWPYEVYSWSAVEDRVRGWLADVKRDLETPDLWDELRRETELLGVASDQTSENTPFTPDEQAQIEKRLRELREYARTTYSLSEPQMQVLDAKLDYLVEATRRQGRTDWFLLFYGAIFSYVLSAALPPETARDIAVMFLRGLAHLLGHHIPELPGG